MSSRQGKHSLKSITCRAYEGASASQKVRAAEWSGALAWNNANHASSSSASNSGGYQHWNVVVDTSKPWFKLDDSGEYKCLLCGAFATEGHIASDKHQQRSANPEWYGFGEEAGGSSGSGSTNGGYNRALWDEPWFVKKEGEYYCDLCGNWATETHITSAKHQKRAQAPQYYGFDLPNAQDPQQGPQTQPAPPSNGLPRGWTEHWSEEFKCSYYHHEETEETTWERPKCAPVSAGAVVPYWSTSHTPPEYDFPYFERKENGEFFCKLCFSYATHGHLESAKHQKRALCPEWWGYVKPVEPEPARQVEEVAARQARQVEEITPVVAMPLPAPWVAYWCEEHNAYYFHNESSGETSWEKPV